LKKKSLWKRGNRGFLVSMILLAGVLVYVTITQVMLAGEKKDIREIGEQVQKTITDMVQVPLVEADELNDTTKAAAYTDGLKKALAPLFVKDSDYLSESAHLFLVNIQKSASEQIEVTALGSIQTQESTIRIDENTATLAMSVTYNAAGTWLTYSDIGVPIEGQQTGSLETDFSASLVLEDGMWKIYRISTVDSYVY